MRYMRLAKTHSAGKPSVGHLGEQCWASLRFLEVKNRSHSRQVESGRLCGAADRACGSGGMFVQSARFVAEHKQTDDSKEGTREQLQSTQGLTLFSQPLYSICGPEPGPHAFGARAGRFDR
jgi:hypothetical protein